MKRLLRLSAAFLAAIALAACAGSAPHEPEPVPEPPKDPTYCERQGTGKEIYVPKEFRGNKGFNNTENEYCYRRSFETDDLIILWAKKFGDDPANAPSKNMCFDVKELARQCQGFFELFRDELQFVKSPSKADKYKMLVMVTYTTEGTVYGGAYDDVIGALWLEPSRIKDARLNAAAHELGHSFQFQLCMDSGSGFGGGGIYEMTSQWMLWQTNPHWFDDETYHWNDYMKQTHYAFMHPDNMYHTCNLLEYWSFLHGPQFIADLWRAAKNSNDVVGVYKKLTGIDQDTFNDQNWDHAARQINYDIPRIKDACAKYANRHSSTLGSADAEGWRPIASNRAPGQYGYNGIKLTAPKQGQTVTIEFKGKSSQKNAGWRFGLVGTAADGSIVYSEMQRADGEEVGSVSLTAESDYKYLWLVVTAAPTSHVFAAENVIGSKPTYPYSVRIN